MSEESDGGKSVKSEFEGALGNENKKLYKKIRNLEYENSILKNELNKEREELHKLRKREANEIENDSTRLRKVLETKTQEILSLKTELDKYQVENIKLTDKLQKSNASIELAKLSHTESPKISIHSPIPNVALTSNGFTQSLADSSRNLENKGNKNNVGTYIGDGNEHYPYYELLNKEFRIRFKRACLKEKELLHKANGLEIGVITEFIEPNEIKIHLHFSNFCDQEPIKGLKIKVSNAKNNKIILEKSYIDNLKVGEQVKQMLTIQIRNYPIGCTALLCEYSYYNRTEEVRVLLPSHIFKMLQIKPRDDEYRSPIEHTLTPEKKIVKDFATLSNYFKNSLVQNNTIKMTMFHNATETKFLVDISFVNHEVHIKYEHRAGNEAITEYVIKTVSFLIKKDTLV